MPERIKTGKRLSGLICLSCLTIASTHLLASLTVNAQLIPDRTLGTENSIITPQGVRDLIQGGAIRGSNLFHSFLEFNVGNQQQVYFTNPTGIANILTRVTGNRASNILGKLGVAGAANLFLINPNGIIFGPNARLDVAGSFVASTSDGIKLGENGLFRATEPEKSTLLTLQPGILFSDALRQYQAEIRNQGTLTVGTGQTLTLQGDTVTSTGSLTAPGGTVQLLAGNILIQPGGTLSGQTISQSLFTNQVILQANNDITVDDNITGIRANHLTFLAGRSLTIAPNRSIRLNGGDLSVKINDENALAVQREAGIAQFVMNSGSQILTNGGNVAIASGSGQTSQIDTVRGAIITGSFTGDGGDITLSALGNITSGLLDSRSAVGIGGNITLDSNGGNISTLNSLLADALLQAGNIFLKAREISTNGLITANAIGQGGNITLNAADNLTLESPGAVTRIGDISSVGTMPGQITLTSGATLLAKDIRILNRISGEGKANGITLSGRSIFLEHSSITTLTRDESQADLGEIQNAQGGDVFIQATDEVMLRNSNISTNADFGTADAGNLTLNTRQLKIIKEPGATFPFPNSIGVSTLADDNSSGNGGDLTINASDSLEIVGDKPGAFTFTTLDTLLSANGAAISTSALGGGNSGDLTIKTGRLILRDNAAISTLPFIGEGGDVTINATDIFLQGLANIGTATLGQDAGDLIVNADRITLIEGANFGTSTFGTGNAGNLTLSVGQLSIRSGSSISTTTFGQGNGGKLTVNNLDSIEITGTSADGSIPSSINAASLGIGNAGVLEITTDDLNIRDGATVSVGVLGKGNAGDININTRSIFLDRGFIAATSLSGEGGSINLRVADNLILRNNSQISTRAGTEDSGGGNGGNIDIDAQFIVAVPTENSDITANAFAGNGGNINITTQSIFGLQVSDQLTPTSDITASSQLGIDGTVNINTLNVDPSQGLVQLPSNLTDLSNQIVAGCPADTGNRFVVTGRGGLPENPTKPLLGQVVLQDTRNSVEGDLTSDRVRSQSHILNPSVDPTLIEAQSWRMGKNGAVILTAEAFAEKQSRSWFSSQYCGVPGQK